MHPTLDLWGPQMKSLYIDQRPLRCSSDANWVEVVNGTFHITEQAFGNHGNISCHYTPLSRGPNDHSVMQMETINITHGDPITSDFFTVKCVGDLSKKMYQNLHSGIYKKKAKVFPLPINAMGLNVLILGLDSVSRMCMQRYFPNTHAYFKETLGGILLEGHNTVGDGTVNNVLPVLCGKTLEELPESRRGKPNATHVDGYPWVWKRYEDLGYMTQYAEDQPEKNTFNSMLTGFKNQPTHHYMRPFFLTKRSRRPSGNSLCLGSERLHVNTLNWVQDFFAAYQNHPKFSLIWLNGLTHGGYIHFAADADKDLLAFIKSMKSRGNLRNTLFILMADHGPRFTKARLTAQGRLEERMPFLGFWVPPELKTKYPIALKNLRTNSHRLTTPFDIHETLLDVFNFREVSLGNLSNRAISLFREIPPERSCVQAGIDIHWCACQELKSLPLNDSVVQKASVKLVDTINSITSAFRNICQLLSLSQTVKAAIYTPRKDMFVTKKSEVHFSITVRTMPGIGLFESTMKYNTLLEQFTVLKQDISRINAYGNQSSCIVETDPSLRGFCYCSEH